MREIPQDSLDDGKMNRIIVHWTAGTHVANDVDLKHYHFLCEYSPMIGEGFITQGNLNPRDNNSTKNKPYAAHTRGLNTGSIGFSFCAMMGATDDLETHGQYPIMEAQIETAITALAELCEHYELQVSEKTLLGHSEVEDVYGKKQAGKWDVEWFPSRNLTGKACMEHLRSAVQERMAERALEPEWGTSDIELILPLQIERDKLIQAKKLEKEENMSEEAKKEAAKPGKSTSEFLVVMIAGAVITAADYFGHTLEMPTVVGLITPAIAYVMSRMGVKMAVSKS